MSHSIQFKIIFSQHTKHALTYIEVNVVIKKHSIPVTDLCYSERCAHQEPDCMRLMVACLSAVVLVVGFHEAQGRVEFQHQNYLARYCNIISTATGSCFYTTNVIFGEDLCPLNKHHRIQSPLFHLNLHICGVMCYE